MAKKWLKPKEEKKEAPKKLEKKIVKEVEPQRSEDTQLPTTVTFKEE